MNAHGASEKARLWYVSDVLTHRTKNALGHGLLETSWCREKRTCKKVHKSTTATLDIVVCRAVLTHPHTKDIQSSLRSSFPTIPFFRSLLPPPPVFIYLFPTRILHPPIPFVPFPVLLPNSAMLVCGACSSRAHSGTSVHHRHHDRVKRSWQDIASMFRPLKFDLVHFPHKIKIALHRGIQQKSNVI